MENNYKQIEFFWGNLEDAINKLIEHKLNGELVFIEFNGQKLYSDIDDMDSAFVKVTGKTKVEFDEMERIRHEEYLESERKHKEEIPELTLKWIENGKKVLNPKYLAKWNKCVPIRLGDLYKGMELEMCLDIVEELNSGCTLEKAKRILERQGHSGMSHSLVCSMISSFCDRGKEFVEFVKL